MKKIIYTCPYVPAEWIAAHGLRPERIIPESVGSTCSAAQREGICPYAASFINEAVTNEDANGVIVTTLCDQMRRAYDIINRDCLRPVLLMNVPNTWQTLSAQRLYMDEIKRLGRFLIRLGGKEPTTSDLVETMLDYDSSRQSIFKSRDHLPANQYAEIIASFGYHGPENIPQIKLSTKPSHTGVSLAIVGGPLMKQNFDILEMVENSGGRIVLNATETGERGMCTPFNRRNLLDDPFMELANAYFTGIQDASRRPNSSFYKWLEIQIKDKAIRGFIFHRYVWCDTWHVELQRLRDWLKIPVLDIDTTGNNETQNNRTANRIGAFLEML
jgi:benzoyl-CoA reductase/2-hydroxyglutaryl-CoA dehydratase subunit BcrC/BadD/HgdB